MKLGDFLRKQFENAGAFNEEMDALVSASGVNEFEISDDTVKAFSANYLTREAAQNDPDILLTIRKDARRHFFDEVDKKVDSVLEHLNPEQAEAIKLEKDTPKRLEMLNDAVKTTIESSTPDSSWKDKVKKLESALSETQATYEGQLAELGRTKDEEISILKTNFTKQRVDDRLKDAIREYKLIDNLPGGFDYLADATIKEIRDEFKLVLNDDTKDIELKKTQDGVDVDVFQDNEKVTLKKILDERLDKFVAKSPKQSQQQQQTNPNPYLQQNEAPKFGNTLAEQNMLKARQNLERAAKIQSEA